MVGATPKIGKRMKRYFFLLLVLVAAVALSACEDKPSDPDNSKTTDTFVIGTDEGVQPGEIVVDNPYTWTD